MSLAAVPILLIAAAIGYWWDECGVSRYVPGVIIMIALPAMAANFGWIPTTSPIYDFIFNYVLSFSICLLMMGIDLRKLRELCLPLVPMLTLAAMLTVVSVYLAGLIIDLGDDAATLQAMWASILVGGLTNILAISQVHGLDPTLGASMIAVDNILCNLFLILMGPLAASARFLRLGGQMAESDRIDPIVSDEAGSNPAAFIRAALLACLIVAASYLLVSATGAQSYALLIVSMITVSTASLLPVRLNPAGPAFTLGWMMMCLVLATIGTVMQLDGMFATGTTFLLFYALAVFILFVLAVVLIRLFRLPMNRMLVSLVTLVSGWPLGACYARSFGWHALAIPALLIGALIELLCTPLGLFLISIGKGLGS
jgi:uncharacterized membrane protein